MSLSFSRMTSRMNSLLSTIMETESSENGIYRAAYTSRIIHVSLSLTRVLLENASHWITCWDDQMCREFQETREERQYHWHAMVKPWSEKMKQE